MGVSTRRNGLIRSGSDIARHLKGRHGGATKPVNKHFKSGTKKTKVMFDSVHIYKINAYDEMMCHEVVDMGSCSKLPLIHEVSYCLPVDSFEHQKETGRLLKSYTSAIHLNLDDLENCENNMDKCQNPPVIMENADIVVDRTTKDKSGLVLGKSQTPSQVFHQYSVIDWFSC